MSISHPTPLDQTVVLHDGRRLGFAEWGDPARTPVFFFHGMPSSRLNGHADPHVLDRRHVRWIAIDRPGMGQRRRETFFDRRAPWLGRAKTAGMAVAARRWPEWTYGQVIKGMPEPDRIIAKRSPATSRCTPEPDTC